MSKTVPSLVLIALSITGCSGAKHQECTNDCGGYYFNPSLANKVSKDTGLHICDKASIFWVRRPAIDRQSQTYEYAIQTIVGGYCPESSMKQIDHIIDHHWVTTYQTAMGRHVTISAWRASGYAVSVWWVAKPNVR